MYTVVLLKKCLFRAKFRTEIEFYGKNYPYSMILSPTIGVVISVKYNFRTKLNPKHRCSFEM